jgi:hypothetical protein
LGLRLAWQLTSRSAQQVKVLPNTLDIADPMSVFSPTDSFRNSLGLA